MEIHEQLLQELRPSSLYSKVSLSWDRGNGLMTDKFIYMGCSEDIPQLVSEKNYVDNNLVFFDKDLLEHIQDYQISQ